MGGESQQSSDCHMQASEVRQLCLKIVLSLISPNNCISLYSMADACTIPELRHACFENILQNFDRAVHLDSKAFCGLELAQLLLILENDFVEVRTYS